MIRLLAIVCLSVSLLACTVRTPSTPSMDAGGTASDRAVGEQTRLWQEFTTRQGYSGPFRIQATLNTVTDDVANRATVYFWGNGGDSAVSRMDILAGPGSVVAKLREDTAGLVMFLPGDGAALVSDGRGSLAAFGMPVPFTLKDLSLLLTGRFPSLFLDGSAAQAPPFAVSTYQGTHTFQLSDGPLPGSLEVDSLARPITWVSSDLDWRLEITYSDEASDAPLRRARLTHPRGHQATILVRDLERAEPFAPSQLDMPLPQGTRIRRISASN